MPFELSDQEKAQLLEQRGRQFAAEKYNHEVNVALLVAAGADDPKNPDPNAAAALEASQTAIATLDDALANVDQLLADLPSANPDDPTPQPTSITKAKAAKRAGRNR